MAKQPRPIGSSFRTMKIVLVILALHLVLLVIDIASSRRPKDRPHH
jgi:hypothetical protein